MTKITRRSFLKGAGVAALAVAAVGVMTGCAQDNVPGTDVPNVPTVTSKEVTLIFVDAATGNGLSPDTNKTYTVLKDATVIDPETIPVSLYPAEWDLAVKGTVEIHDNGNTVFAIIPVVKGSSSEINKETQEVEITCQVWNAAMAGGDSSFTVKITVPADATTYTQADVTLLDGYEFYEESFELPLGAPVVVTKL